PARCGAMFSVARWARSLGPGPPGLAAATFRRSLGAVCPRPGTCRGTIAKPADVAATLVTNFRLDILPMVRVSNYLDCQTADDTSCFRLHSRKGGPAVRRPWFGFLLLIAAASALAAQAPRERALFDGKTTG